MTEWKAKRFWTDVTVEATDGGFGVLLDGRRLNTPGRLPLILPTRAMAEAVAAEWRAQDGLIKPQTMPVTRSANSAVERVAAQKPEVAAMLAAYAETDLLCHRAGAPVELAERQAGAWDPVLSWCATRFDAPLTVTIGVLPVDQPQESLDRLHAVVEAIDPFRITALHDLVALSGSLLLGLAVSEGVISPEEGWRLSRIDEDWQTEHWGEDEEARAASDAKADQFLHAARFWALSAPE